MNTTVDINAAAFTTNANSTTFLNSNYSPTTQQQNDTTNGVNMSLSSPSPEEMNRIISYGSTSEVASNRPEDAAFGTHIREGIDIVKDWIK
jgi:hypothetical protein